MTTDGSADGPGDPEVPPAHPSPLDRVPAIARFDAAVDRALEHLRGHPVIDRVLLTASHAAEFSLVWQAIAWTLGLLHHDLTAALRISVLIGLESLLVNQGIKRLFRRQRPTTTGDPRLQVRAPTTSSFPSGHSSSAFFAATLLTQWEPGLAPLWYLLAATVALSRVYVRIHHASDVVAGALLGLGLGGLAAWLWPPD